MIVRFDRAGQPQLVGFVVSRTGEKLDLALLRRGLASLLPPALVPAVVVALDRLPMTVNRKIDKRALQELDIWSATPYRAARTPEEARLCLAFETVLGVERVGIDDDFFARGGHSMLAVQLVARVRETMGVELPIRQLFATPTVAGLVAALEGSTEEGRGDPFAPMLPIRAGGDLPPLFFIHPAGGLSWCYTPVVRYLEPNRPVYGLQARGITDATALPATFDDLVADYARQIQRLQPVGPYHLGGWSLGGNVAHAVAGHLQREGHDVGLLALFDSVPPMDFGAADQGPVERPVPASEAAARRQPAVAADQAPHAPSINKILKSLAADPQIERNIDAVVAHMVEVMKTYTPQRYRGDVLFITSTDHTGKGLDTAWRPWISGDFDGHAVEASHPTLMWQPGAVKQIGSLLAAALAKAPTPATATAEASSV